MNDPDASGRGIREWFLFKSRSQRNAGLHIYVRWVGWRTTWRDVSNPPLRLVAGLYVDHVIVVFGSGTMVGPGLTGGHFLTGTEVLPGFLENIENKQYKP